MVRESKDGSRVYQGHAEICAECPFKPRCCQSEKGQARTISTAHQELLRQDMNRKMQTTAAQTTYKQRIVIVEPVFGQIKNSGFRGFSVRGKDNVAGEFSIVCAAHNFKKNPQSHFEVLNPSKIWKWRHSAWNMRKNSHQ